MRLRCFRCVLSVCVWGWGALGVVGGWMPLPTRPQRYCDPASLVNLRACRIRTLFCSFRRASNICFICAICTNSFVVFFLFFAFLCPSEHRFLAYVCLHRDILPVCSPYDNVRASFIVFASFLLSWRRFYRFGVVFIIILRISFANFTFLFCFRAYCERCGGKLR